MTLLECSVKFCSKNTVLTTHVILALPAVSHYITCVDGIILVCTVSDGDIDDDDDDTIMILIIGSASGVLSLVTLITAVLCCCCTVQRYPCYLCCHKPDPMNTMINTADGLDTDTLLDKPTRSNTFCKCC